MDKLHTVVHFSGRVQGVGFRYHTFQISKEFEVAGYVKNLLDGRVIVEAVGSKDEVNAFIAEIQDRLGVFIRETERKDGEPSKSFMSFEIR
jgi:acylphosphatase